MRLQTFHRSSLLTFQTRVQEAVLSERARRKRHSEERARIGTRGGARVGFGTVSTTVYRSPNAVARRRRRNLIQHSQSVASLVISELPVLETHVPLRSGRSVFDPIYMRSSRVDTRAVRASTRKDGNGKKQTRERERYTRTNEPVRVANRQSKFPRDPFTATAVTRTQVCTCF